MYVYVYVYVYTCVCARVYTCMCIYKKKFAWLTPFGGIQSVRSYLVCRLGRYMVPKAEEKLAIRPRRGLSGWEVSVCGAKPKGV
jgi:hypothetical protein